ncbi:MAG: GntR family uxuAB operon transcriptional repressor [Saprospiraceae bacterium]|jgi:GntR family uxuAB operon transcriptional repressor
MNIEEPQLSHVIKGSTGVYVHLKEAILSGHYQYDERLPPERELAAAYNVARGTIRSALQRLEKSHLVRIKTGSGTFAIYNPQFQKDDIAEDTSPMELIQTRIAIEPYIVKLAVTNASNRDLRQLEDAVTQLERTRDDSDAFSIADETFHLILAQCSQNPLLIWMYQRINDIRSHTQWTARKDNVLTPEAIDHYNMQHRAMLSAIKRRDAPRAMEIMTEHLRRARADLDGTL